jgi:hypothetical protein
MTAERAIAMTQNLLAAVGISGWTVSVVRFTDFPKRFGLTSRARRTIFLNWMYLHDDDEMRETIVHECTHVFAPGLPCSPFDDKIATADFAAAFREVERAWEELSRASKPS